MRFLIVPALVAVFYSKSGAFPNEPTPAVPPVTVAPAAEATALVQESPTNLTRPIALRIVGSNVKNLKGEYLGRIEEAALNPESKQIEFAILNVSYPTNTSRVTPVPWHLLNYVWDQGQVGGTPGAVQIFRLDIDKARLMQAPTIDRTQTAELLSPPLRQLLHAFFGGNVESIGATGSASVASTGGASGGVAARTAAGAVGTTAAAGALPYGPVSGGVYPVSPGLLVIGPQGTNNQISISNGVTVTNIVSSTNRVPADANTVSGGTNVFAPRGTNVFTGGSTNNMGGGTNVFAGGTNTFSTRASASPGSTNRAILSPTGRAAGENNPNQQQAPPTIPPAQNTAPHSAPGGSPWSPPQTIIVPVPPPTANPPLPGASAPSDITLPPPTLPDSGGQQPVPPITPLPPAPGPQPGVAPPGRP